MRMVDFVAKIFVFSLFALPFAAAFILLFSVCLSLLDDTVLRLMEIAAANTTQNTQFSCYDNGGLIAMFGVITTLLGVFITFWIFRVSSAAQRKQHTIASIQQNRLSEDFQNLLRERRRVFSEFTDVTFEKWERAKDAQPINQSQPTIERAQQKRKGAAAIIHLLNYYEFLALCIEEKIMDREILRKTIRGIMCNFVDDARLLISGLRHLNPNTYEHLVALYDSWRDMDAKDINGNPNERPIPE